MAQTRYANQHQMSGKSKVKMVGTYLTAAAGAPSPRPFFVPTFSAASRGGRSGLFGIIGRTRRSRPHRARSDHPVGRTPRLTSVYLGRLPSSVWSTIRSPGRANTPSHVGISRPLAKLGMHTRGAPAFHREAARRADLAPPLLWLASMRVSAVRTAAFCDPPTGGIPKLGLGERRFG